MALVRLTNPRVTWALALESAFEDPSAPTAAELNDRAFVHLVSCGLTEDGTNFDLTDSDTDTTRTWCDVGNVANPVRRNYGASLTWLLDANTGGSGSTADLTSLYNKLTAMLGQPDVPYWLIRRMGPNSVAQDANFATGQIIQMAQFKTDFPQLLIETGTPARMTQALLAQGGLAWNVDVA